MPQRQLPVPGVPDFSLHSCNSDGYDYEGQVLSNLSLLLRLLSSIISLTVALTLTKTTLQRFCRPVMFVILDVLYFLFRKSPNASENAYKQNYDPDILANKNCSWIKSLF